MSRKCRCEPGDIHPCMFCTFPPDELEITQADREAAADWLRGIPLEMVQSINIRQGSVDSHQLVQNFAKHRLCHSLVDENLKAALEDVANHPIGDREDGAAMRTIARRALCLIYPQLRRMT